MNRDTRSSVNVWDCALSFMHAQMLLTAEKLGVFDRLDGDPCTAEEVAAAVDLPPDSARRLLTGLCALDLVERRSDGRYRNRPEASEQLVTGKPGYIGDFFHHVRNVLYPAWEDFEEALRNNPTAIDTDTGSTEPRQDGSKQELNPEEKEVPSEAVYEDEESLRSFMDGMHTLSYGSGQTFAANAPELQDVEHLVDVGGASGAFLIAVAESFPELQGTVLDLPPVRPIAEEYISNHDLDDRLSFEGADFFNDPLPEGADAYSLGFVLHDWDKQAGSHLLEKIAASIQPGGLLIIGESLLNEDRTGPLHVARNDLNMLVVARGRERTAQEYENWIADYGFELERIQPTEEKDFLIARHQGDRP